MKMVREICVLVRENVREDQGMFSSDFLGGALLIFMALLLHAYNVLLSQ